MQYRSATFLVFGLLTVTTLGAGCSLFQSDEQSANDLAVHLQNQADHSGILIRSVDWEAFALTDSTGQPGTVDLPNGRYAFEIAYPYFEARRDTLEVIDRQLRLDSTIVLNQILRFWTEPGIVHARELDTTSITAYVENLTDSTQCLCSTSNQVRFALRLPDSTWPHDWCEGATRVAEGLLGVAEAQYIGARSTSVRSYELSDVLRPFEACVPEASYELFVMGVDAPLEWPAKRAYFTIGEVSSLTLPDFLQLNSSLYRKPMLASPITIRVD